MPADNYNLTPEQHARCVDWVGKLQQLYDGAGAYAERHDIDPELVFAGNEWAGISHRTGLKLPTTFNDINYLRLNAPFAGYHLAILDRLDQRRFPDDWGEAFVTRMASGIPDDIAEVFAARVPARDQLTPLVPEYLDHTRNVPARYIVAIPRMLGEVGLEVDGVLIHNDVILSQSRINGMLCSGVLDKLDWDIARRGRVRVLEVGAGYGAMGYALKAIYGDRLEYVGVGLPSSLYYSLLYLGATSDWDGRHLLRSGEAVPERFNFLFLTNYMLGEFADAIGPIDMAFNCMSFPEMSKAQVRDYGAFFKKMLRDDGIVFDETAALKPHHTDRKAILSEFFPYRKTVASTIVATKNWCQDVWASRYIGSIFDRQDVLFLRSSTFKPSS
jgi:hypothetical protein